MTMPRLLIVAGSDSGGGAGIQADIKAASAMGAYAATAITAITVQNTLGVRSVHTVAPQIVAAQMRAVLEDIGADCIKTGMLVDAATIEAVAQVLDDYDHIPLVLDPVMVSTSGHALIDDAAIDILKDRLMPRALLLTPNIPEAERILGILLADEQSRQQAARALMWTGPQAVLLKGGHAGAETIIDYLASRDGVETLAFPRVDTTSTHGTGCTLASAIAARIAAGDPLPTAVHDARTWLQRALMTAPGLGKGHGPVNHLVPHNSH